MLLGLSRKTWGLLLTLMLSYRVILGSLLDNSVPPYPYLQKVAGDVELSI